MMGVFGVKEIIRISNSYRVIGFIIYSIDLLRIFMFVMISLLI